MRISVFYAGLCIGLLAVLAQAFLGYTWIGAYGVCTVGHSRDFMRWVLDNVIGLEPTVYVVPLVTTFGIVLGSAFSSLTTKDLKIIHCSRVKFVTSMMLGFIVITFGLIAGACPTRFFIMITYGDLYGLLGIIGYVIGIALAIRIIRWH
jgi:hypothetical protein